MTKYEKKIKEMLSYYEISMSGNKDEKMTKNQQKNFLDNLNQNYDRYVMEEIVSKVKDNIKNMKDEEELDDESLFNAFEEESEETPNKKPNKKANLSDKNFMGINPEIEMFIQWLYNLLYSADHKLTVEKSKDGAITNIRMEKIKKRGGKKK